jgi:hypothetical protein
MSDNVSPAKAAKKISKEIAKLDRTSTPLLNKLVTANPKQSKGKPSKYSRYTTDMDSLRDAYGALPSVYKFFWMIYRLSPLRTMVIIAVFMVQGLLPALRLRTGGDFIRQVRDPGCSGFVERWLGTDGSCKRAYRAGL